MDEMNERVCEHVPTWAHLLESSGKTRNATVHNYLSINALGSTNDTLVSISTPPLQLHI